MESDKEIQPKQKPRKMNKENTTAKDYLKSTDFTKEILCSKETSDKFAYYLEDYANKRVSEALEEVSKEALRPMHLKRLRDKHGYFGGPDNGGVIDREIKRIEDAINKIKTKYKE